MSLLYTKHLKIHDTVWRQSIDDRMRVRYYGCEAESSFYVRARAVRLDGSEDRRIERHTVLAPTVPKDTTE